MSLWRVILFGILAVARCKLRAELAPAACIGDVELVADLEEESLHLIQRAAARRLTHIVSFPTSETANATRNTHGRTASSIVGVYINSSGDLDAFKSSLLLNTSITLAAFIAFLVLRREYPAIYQYYNDRLEMGPPELTDSMFSPLLAAWMTSVDDVVENVGLDHAMLVQFSNFSMKVMLAVGAPAFMFLIPMYAFAGEHAAGSDKLTYLGLGNVGKNSWMCWPAALFVWYVVAVVQYLVFKEQSQEFMPRRKRWLVDMPSPRASTVLVENIPLAYRTEDKLNNFMSGIFGPGCIDAISVVRDLSKLRAAIAAKDECSQQLHEAEIMWDQQEHVEEEHKSKLRVSLQAAEEKVVRMRSEELAKPEVVSSTAFVTFSEPKHSVMALAMRYTEDDEEFVISVPPDPSDVRFDDLIVDPRAEVVREVLGYALIAGLFFGFVPIVAAITNVTTLESLETIPVMKAFFSAHPAFGAYWNALAASLGLTLFMSFLPTFLVWIFASFFAMKSDAWLQHLVQQWYFYFLMVFVLLVTAVGSSLWEQTRFLVDHPTEMFNVLAATLPTTTHFYLNYVPLQWGSSAIVMTRYMNLAKYLGLKGLMSLDRARELAEPEDQDYYGMGSRSARHTLTCVIGIVLCTLTPMITPLVFINACIDRTCLAYLFVYAESRKTDLGGAFWHSMLRHIQQGLLVYVILMTGVLLQRGNGLGPGITAGSSAALWLLTYRRFRHQFHFESLPLKEISDGRTLCGEVRKSSAGTNYEQPELQRSKSMTRSTAAAAA